MNRALSHRLFVDERTVDSQALHRVKGAPRETRGIGIQSSSSDPTIQRPFGTLPNRIAGILNRNEITPVLEALGFTGGSPKFQRQLATSTGPLAGLLRFLIPLESQFPQQAAQIGRDAAARGGATFTALQGQVDDLLGRLPGLEDVSQQATAGATESLTAAERVLANTMDPTSQTPLFEESARRLLAALRPGEAGRGFENQGAGAQAETDALRNLTFDTARTQQGDQLQAIQALLGASSGAQGAASNDLSIAGAGIQPLQNLFSLIPQLTQNQTQPFALPLEAIQGFLQLLQGGQGNALNLLGATAPVVASTSRSSGLQVL